MIIPLTMELSAGETDAEAVEIKADFDTLFRREYPSVARLAFLLLGRTGEAEEVTQEAFVTLLTRWDEVANPNGFVRTAVVNRCRDIARRRVVRDRIVRRLRPDDQDASEADYLVDALQHLPVQLRSVIVLRFYLGHTVPEIASILDVPEGTVKSRLHRALQDLRRRLEPG